MVAWPAGFTQRDECSSGVAGCHCLIAHVAQPGARHANSCAQCSGPVRWVLVCCERSWRRVRSSRLERWGQVCQALRHVMHSRPAACLTCLLARSRTPCIAASCSPATLVRAKRRRYERRQSWHVLAPPLCMPIAFWPRWPRCVLRCCSHVCCRCVCYASPRRPPGCCTRRCSQPLAGLSPSQITAHCPALNQLAKSLLCSPIAGPGRPPGRSTRALTRWLAYFTAVLPHRRAWATTWARCRA